MLIIYFDLSRLSLLSLPEIYFQAITLNYILKGHACIEINSNSFAGYD